METTDTATCTNKTSLGVVVTHCLTRKESVGLTLVAESAVASSVAVVWISVLILRNYYVRVMRHPAGLPVKRGLIETPGDIFMLSLFAADLTHAIGGMINFRWITEGKVELGAFCTAQGAIQQIGATAIAMTTLAIAVQTFVAVWWGRGLYSTFNAAVVVGAIWLCNFLFVAIGVGTHPNKSDYYMTPTPYWCWIGPDYMAVRMAEEYGWFWLTLLVSLLAYVPLFFWSRGNITVDRDKWFTFRFHDSEDSEDDSNRRRRSLSLIAYPLIYSVLIIPLSAVRWVEFIHGETEIRPAAVFAVFTLYGLSGVFDVVLFLIARPTLLLFSDESSRSISQDEEELVTMTNGLE